MQYTTTRIEVTELWSVFSCVVSCVQDQFTFTDSDNLAHRRFTSIHSRNKSRGVSTVGGSSNQLWLVTLCSRPKMRRNVKILLAIAFMANFVFVLRSYLYNNTRQTSVVNRQSSAADAVLKVGDVAPRDGDGDGDLDVAAAAANDAEPREKVEREGTRQETKEEKEGRRRTLQYCDPYRERPTGDEGNVPNEFKLLNVHIVIRHGDRTPLFNLPVRQEATLRCDVSTAGDPLATRYVDAMTAFSRTTRSGSVAARLGLFPRHETCGGGGQLTGVGALQHLRSGNFLRRVYVTKHGLLDGGSKGNDVQFHTTNTPRTFRSGVAFLHGLLPRANLSALPVRVSDSIHFCRPRIPGLPCTCALVGRLDLNIGKMRRKRTTTKAETDAMKRDLAESFDRRVEDVPPPGAVTDGLMAFACHGHPLPCGGVDDDRCVTWAMVRRIWRIIDANTAADAANFVVTKRSHLLAHPLLHEIASRMLNVIRGIITAKLILYSGHDTTVTPLTIALGVYDGRWPPYASRVVFELYGRGRSGLGDADDVYFMRVLFNGEDRTKYLRFCAETQLIKGLCPLRNFIHFVHHGQLQTFGQSNYTVACSNK